MCSVHPGELLKLSCPLPEAAAIIWTKDGSSLGPDNRTRIDQEWLQIRDATPKDSGLYECSAPGSRAGDALCFIVNVTGEMTLCRVVFGDRFCWLWLTLHGMVYGIVGSVVMSSQQFTLLVVV